MATIIDYKTVVPIIIKLDDFLQKPFVRIFRLSLSGLRHCSYDSSDFGKRFFELVLGLYQYFGDIQETIDFTCSVLNRFNCKAHCGHIDCNIQRFTSTKVYDMKSLHPDVDLLLNVAESIYSMKPKQRQIFLITIANDMRVASDRITSVCEFVWLMYCRGIATLGEPIPGLVLLAPNQRWTGDVMLCDDIDLSKPFVEETPFWKKLLFWRSPDVETISTAMTTEPPPRSIPIAEFSIPMTESTPKVTESTPRVTESIPRVTESIPRVTESTPRVTESTTRVTESTPRVTESTPSVTESTLTVTESTPRVTESTPRVTESTPRVTESTPRVTESTPRVTESTPRVTESTTRVTESTPSVTESTLTVTESTPRVTESTPRVTDSTPRVTESTPRVTESTPSVTESTPSVTESTPSVTESTLTVTESTPRVTESTPRVTESTPRVTDSTPSPRVTDSTPRVTESTPKVTDSTPRMTDSTPRMTDSTPSPRVTDSTPRVAKSIPKVTESSPRATESTSNDIPMTESMPTNTKSVPAPRKTNENTLSFTEATPLNSTPTATAPISLIQKDSDVSSNVDTNSHLPVYEEIGGIKYDPDDVLGEGNSGTCVFNGLYNNQKVAVKRTNTRNKLNQNEKDILFACRFHENIVQYYHIASSREFNFIALQLCQGSLRQFVLGNPYKLTVNKKAILKDMLSGIEHLHCQNIIHRDIKPDNILLTQRTVYPYDTKALLCDFGISSIIKQGKHSATTKYRRGPDTWLSPEMLIGRSVDCCTKALDIFGAGCVMYYLLTDGRHPFGVDYDIPNNIIQYNCNVEEDLSIDDWKSVRHLIKLLIAQEKEARPLADEALSHCYFWPNEKRLLFLVATSNWITYNGRKDLALLGEIERNNFDVFGSNWLNVIDSRLKEELLSATDQKYDGTSLESLLLAIKNMKQKSSYDNFFLAYFTVPFPSLLICLYQSMKKHSSTDRVLSDYYPGVPYSSPSETQSASAHNVEPYYPISTSTVTCDDDVPPDLEKIKHESPKLPHLLRALKIMQERWELLARALQVSLPDRRGDDFTLLSRVLSTWLSTKGHLATIEYLLYTLRITLKEETAADELMSVLAEEDVFEEYI